MSRAGGQRMWRACLALVAVALAALVAAVHAQTSVELEAEARRIDAALGCINEVQASVCQQFQMEQELRRAALARPDPSAPQPNFGIAPPPRN